MLQGGERTGGGRSTTSVGKSTRGSSRFRGVSWCEKGQKWRALLWDGNRQVDQRPRVPPPHRLLLPPHSPRALELVT